MCLVELNREVCCRDVHSPLGEVGGEFQNLICVVR